MHKKELNIYINEGNRFISPFKNYADLAVRTFSTNKFLVESNRILSNKEFFEKTKKLIDKCDCAMIIWNSNTYSISMEIGYIKGQGKKIFLLNPDDGKIPKEITNAVDVIYRFDNERQDNVLGNIVKMMCNDIGKKEKQTKKEKFLKTLFLSIVYFHILWAWTQLIFKN